MKDQKTIKFDGIEVPVVSLSEKDLGECVGEAKPGKPRKNHETAGSLKEVKYEKTEAFSRMWWKPVGAVASDGKYVRVMKRRLLAIIALLLIVLSVLELALWAATGQNAAKNVVNYVGDRTGVTKPNEDVKGKVDEYTSFESIPESITWKAGSDTQDLTLKNLDDNTVELAPQVYVDLNGNGKFSKKECVYNSDASSRIQPGKSVKSITLNQSIPSGTYKGRVVYKAFIHHKDGSDSAANGMNFDFQVDVK